MSTANIAPRAPIFDPKVPTRREALGAAGFTALAALAAASFARPDVATAVPAVDTTELELLGLERRIQAIDAEQDRLQIRADEPSTRAAEQKRLWSEIHALSADGDAALDRVTELRPATRTGLLAKARIVRAHLGFGIEEGPDSRDRLAWSLCRDIIGGLS